MTTLLALGLSLVLALLSTAIVAALAGDGSLSGIARCWLAGRHDPHRAGPWSAYRCVRCGGVDEDAAGYVRPGNRPAAHREGRAMREVSGGA
jgi:hypothetical protein